MHVAIARAAEEHDWLASGSHYSRGGAPDDAMRVLGAAAYKALGTGAWGAATAVVASTPGVVPPPAVEVIRARSLIADGRAPEALDVLASLESRGVKDSDLPLVSIARSAAHHTLGQVGALADEALSIRQRAQPGSVTELVGYAWGHMAVAFQGGPIGPCDPLIAIWRVRPKQSASTTSLESHFTTRPQRLSPKPTLKMLA